MFHTLSQAYSRTIISAVGWMSGVFPLKCGNDHFPTCTTDISKFTLPHKTYPTPPPPFLGVLDLRLTGNYTSVPGFVTVLVDVPLEL
jgi:hypothetical protein